MSTRDLSTAVSEKLWVKRLLRYLQSQRDAESEQRGVSAETVRLSAATVGARPPTIERPVPVAPAPGVARPVAARVAVAHPVVVARTAVATPRLTVAVARLEPKWLIKALPQLVFEPTPAPSPQVKAGDFLLWPDSARSHAFFALTIPRLRDFSLTVRRQELGNTTATTGGTAVIAVSAYPHEDLEALEGYRQEWSDKLAEAGYGSPSWKFQPLTLRNLRASLMLPSGYTTGEPQVAASVEAGTATFLADLSAEGALAWKSALEAGRPDSIQGVCSLEASYYAKSGQQQIDVRQQMLSAPLGTLASQLGPEAVHAINPELSVEAKIIVVDEPTIERVSVHMQPRGGGQPEAMSFGPEGGCLTLQLTSQDLGDIEIDWTAQVVYKPTSWPVIHHWGKLGGNIWTEIINPASWIRTHTLFAVLLDEAGNVIPAGSAEDVDPENRVCSELSFTAPYLQGASPLQTCFETSTQQQVKVAFPRPPGEPPGEVRLTMYAVRGGQVSMAPSRMLQPSETVVMAQVHPDARIEIITNQDPLAELSLESEILGLLSKTEEQVAEHAESERPWISGPPTHDAEGEPPAFLVNSGLNPFYVVEVATRAELFDLDNCADEQSWDNFYASDWDYPFLSSPTYTLPEAVWDRLKGAGRLYYRIWTSESDTEWLNCDVSTPNDRQWEAPYIEIVGGGAVAATMPDSRLADRFVPAHSDRYCFPGQAGSATCQNLPSPRPVNRVVIHTVAVAGDSRESGVEKVIRGWQGGGRQAGAHYLVDRDGTITQMVREENVAFHIRGANQDSIGIEHADVCNTPAPLTTQLYERSAALVRDIAARHGFSIDDSTVAGHCDIGGHGDPGPYWDWDYYRALLVWDGQTAEDHPVRIVVTTADIGSAPTGWQVRSRTQVLGGGVAIPDTHCASKNHSYSDHYWTARPSSTGAAAVLQANIDEPGVYKVSLWWPNVSGANPAVPVDLRVSCLATPYADASLQTDVVNQRPSFGRWNDVGHSFEVVNPPVAVELRVRRDSSPPGWILVDAMRLLKIGSVWRGPR